MATDIRRDSFFYQNGKILIKFCGRQRANKRKFLTICHDCIAKPYHLRFLFKLHPYYRKSVRLYFKREIKFISPIFIP